MLGFSSNTWTRKIDHLQNFQYSVRSHTMKKKHFKHCSQTLPGKDTNEYLKYTIILRSPKPSFYFKNLHELHGDLSTPFDHVASSDNNITQSIMEEISKIYKDDRRSSDVYLMCILFRLQLNSGAIFTDKLQWGILKWKIRRNLWSSAQTSCVRILCGNQTQLFNQ